MNDERFDSGGMAGSTPGVVTHGCARSRSAGKACDDREDRGPAERWVCVPFGFRIASTSVRKRASSTQPLLTKVFRPHELHVRAKAFLDRLYAAITSPLGKP
jgi:hypothetical protein